MLGYHGDCLAGFSQSEPVPLTFRTLNTLEELIEALSKEWADAHMMFDIANLHETEGDSDGSMLTRSALVLLYAMLAAHLSFFGRLAVVINADAFDDKMRNYFNEVDYKIDISGRSVLVDVKQSFEDRASAVPSLIAAKLCPKKLVFRRGDRWFQDAFKKYFELRNGVMHSKFGECLPRVSKTELREAFESVHGY